MKRISLLAVAGVAAALALTACGSSGSSSKSTTGAPTSGGSNASAASGPGSVIVGSADFAENVLLANIYADAMSAKGVKVTKKLNIGERAAYIPALKDGSIDFIPEYSGSILYYLDPKATAKSPADVYAALPTAAGSDLSVLQYAAAQDSDTITVTKATASKYHLTSIADLQSVASKLTLGAPAAFQTRADGVPALKSVYGVTFGTFTPISASGSITVDSLKNGNIDAADIFSTDPSIAANDFVSLTDPKSMFAAQNIIPLVSKAKLTSTITDAANAVSAKLDTATLASLVTKVQVDKQDSDTVAKAWLSSVGLG
ncbi:osmoprotectant transport system substrate-binding protein [Frankineae bacterium MT45]|nr:osmoprotectant transport system substrate-binding protein [Frankineae bacterium MT45]